MRGRWVAALLACCLFAGFGAAQAVPVPEEVTHGIPHQALFDVAFSGAHGYAVGAGGQILATADGGRTWKDEKSPTPLSLLGVAVDGTLAVAVGQMGTVLVKDGSGAWEQVPSGIGNRLMQVAIHDNTVVVVGAFGAFIRSTDRGQTWTKIDPGWNAIFKDGEASGALGFNFKPKLYVCTYDGRGNLFVAGEVGIILESRDNGATWAVVRKGSATSTAITPTIFGLSINSKGVGVAVGQNGSIIRTADDGATWTPVQSGSTAILLSALTKDDGTILVTGAYAMLWSADGGEHWTPVSGKGNFISSAWYSEVAGNSQTDGDIVVGQNATILRVKR